MERGDSSMEEAQQVSSRAWAQRKLPDCLLKAWGGCCGHEHHTATCMACAPSEESARRPCHVGTAHMCVCHRVQQGAGRSPSAPKRMPQQGAHKTQVQLVREKE